MTPEEFAVFQNESILAGGAWFRIVGVTDLFFVPLVRSNGIITFSSIEVPVRVTKSPPYKLAALIGTVEHELDRELGVEGTLTRGHTVTLFSLEVRIGVK